MSDQRERVWKYFHPTQPKTAGPFFFAVARDHRFSKSESAISTLTMTSLCFICVERVRITQGHLSSHLLSAHDWQSAHGCSYVVRVSLYFWRFGFATQCLAILNACETREEYLNGLAQIPRFILDTLVYPPGYSAETVTHAEALGAANIWKDKYTLAEEELIKALETRQFFLGIYALRILHSFLETKDASERHAQPRQDAQDKQQRIRHSKRVQAVDQEQQQREEDVDAQRKKTSTLASKENQVVQTEQSELVREVFD